MIFKFNLNSTVNQQLLERCDLLNTNEVFGELFIVQFFNAHSYRFTFPMNNVMQIFFYSYF